MLPRLEVDPRPRCHACGIVANPGGICLWAVVMETVPPPLQLGIPTCCRTDIANDQKGPDGT